MSTIFLLPLRWVDEHQPPHIQLIRTTYTNLHTRFSLTEWSRVKWSDRESCFQYPLSVPVPSCRPILALSLPPPLRRWSDKLQTRHRSFVKFKGKQHWRACVTIRDPIHGCQISFSLIILLENISYKLLRGINCIPILI